MAPFRVRLEPVDLTPYGFEVLLSLASGPMHGYAIKLDIEQRTGGEVSLSSGTLYTAIHRLEREELIVEVPGTGDRMNGRRGRTYRLEPRGRVSLEHHLRRLSRAVAFARARKLLPSTK